MRAPSSVPGPADVELLDVIVVGCGPTGAVLANLLGALGCRIAVLERAARVAPVPRATHVDEETLRNFQATGLMNLLEEHTRPFGPIDVVDEDGAVLLEGPVDDPAVAHGYAGPRMFDQPAFERILRAGLHRYPRVTLELGAEVQAIEDRGDRVAVTARRADGTERRLHASWVVGCDGGRSRTRALLGIGMEALAPPRPWLIVDTLLRDMADAARLPDRFRYLLARERLTLFAYGIGANRRFEFQLGADEAEPGEETVRRWLARFIDPGRLRITRVARYLHNALLARSFRAGRVLLAGDAAHMMPPSAGQGMCAGVRDAVNLAWKLHLVTNGRAPPALLDSYERERRPHVRDVLKGSLFIGARLCAEGWQQRLRRRLELRLIGAVPPVQALLRRFSLRRPPLRAGFLDGSSRWHGHHLPQVPVRDLRHGERTALLDDLLGYRFGLVLGPGLPDGRAARWAEEQGIGVVRPGVDFLEPDGGLLHWMRRRRLDFVLARPDRQIFGAGAARDLPRVQASLAEQLG